VCFLGPAYPFLPGFLSFVGGGVGGWVRGRSRAHFGVARLHVDGLRACLAAPQGGSAAASAGLAAAAAGLGAGAVASPYADLGIDGAEVLVAFTVTVAEARLATVLVHDVDLVPAALSGVDGGTAGGDGARGGASLPWLPGADAVDGARDVVVASLSLLVGRASLAAEQRVGEGTLAGLGADAVRIGARVGAGVPARPGADFAVHGACVGVALTLGGFEVRRAASGDEGDAVGGGRAALAAELGEFEVALAGLGTSAT